MAAVPRAVLRPVMVSMSIARRAFRILLFSALFACGEGGGTEPPVTPVATELTIVATGSLTDTALALDDTVVVRLTDQNGAPMSGRAVRFDAENDGPAEPQLWLLAGSSTVFTTTVTTSADGRAMAVVGRGPATGEARVIARVGELRDTATYVTLPGTPHTLAAEPSDTGIYVGGSFVFRARWLDRSGNVSPVAPVWTSGRPDLLSVKGDTVRAEAVGYAPVIASHGTRADTQWVAVVPRATIAANWYPGTLVTIGLDGSGVDTLDNCSGRAAQGVRWSPDGNALAYFVQTSSMGLAALYHLELGGDCRDLSGPTAGHTNPAFSPDGTWIYFNATIGHGTEIWRILPDGTGLERAGPETVGADRDLWPQVSPDGQLLTFWTSRGSSAGLAAMHQTTGELTIHPVDAQAPRWSPSGDLIAYIRNDRLRVAPPDFSTERTLDPDNFVAWDHQYFDWSPDGEWIIRKNLIGLSIIRVADGLVMPLKYLVSLESPAWRPCEGPACGT
jgi:WD40 repeat protein